jgi:hypothetical protein
MSQPDRCVGRHGSIKATLRKLLQDLTRSPFLAPQCFQLVAIDVLLDGVAHQPTQ